MQQFSFKEKQGNRWRLYDARGTERNDGTFDILRD